MLFPPSNHNKVNALNMIIFICAYRSLFVKIIYEPANSDALTMGSSATLRCDNGYKPSQQSKIVCITGSWYPLETFGECVAVSTSG
ncbi:unnamed protein product [Gongylonema pulchrum]|uniref:Sushi domain-containing protein n=1 Tax=Gongylonema pulchrum TaxID=637853 RepID=A0A183F0X2_9BILA|nr:unnamed protein product [Gongylonema pulchrum]